MNVLVFDVPAVSGGALSILREYHEQAVNDPNKNKTWYFIVSLPELRETENVKVLRFPWVKNSWFHRLYFDYFVAPCLVKRYKPKEILSLQNVTIPRVKVPQALYLHQALPFVSIRFQLTENPLFWIYQNIIGRRIIRSIQSANRVIVQAAWMKEACIRKAKVCRNKISVTPPEIRRNVNEFFEPTDLNLRTFFYPASEAVYKNHEVIVNAAMLLKARGISNYRVVFTLRGNENKHISKLFRQVKEHNLPIEFIGYIPQDQVYDYYRRSILLFPSYIETFGLPMLEAKMHRTPVIASDCPFSHEILDGYDRVRFFRADDAETLAELMAKSHDVVAHS